MSQSGRYRILAMVAVVSIAAYLSVYVFLSNSGQYKGDAEILDEVYGPCLCMSSDEYWQPRHIILARYSDEFLANGYGYLFFPLVKLDQRFWHPTKDIVYRPMTDEELRKEILEMQEQNKR